jgi:hypothetical protein
METKQLAVDFAFDQLSIENLLSIFTHDQRTQVMEILVQSKEMEKQHIIESYRVGRVDQQNNPESNYNRIAEQYYNETYGGNK